MNSIKSIVYIVTLTMSHHAFGMFGFGHSLISTKNIVSSSQETITILQFAPEEQHSLLFEYINDNKKLSKSDPSAIQMMEEAKKMQTAYHRQTAREKRKTW
jgi:hypothetical protein